MSLKTVHTTQVPWFYPTGNTPPVCLTQTLPPEQDTALLLLGCGDFRSILFTAYSEPVINSRTLDFTCCDIEAEIIARNILALSIIVDDTKGEHVHQLWDIYHHVFIDEESVALLRSQAQKLCALAGSLETWSDGPYATLIRFCDSATLGAVAKLWKFCALGPATGSTYKDAQTLLKQQWGAAKLCQKTKISGTGFAVDNLRAAAPLFSQGYEDLSKHYQAFWRNGTCFHSKKMAGKFNIANPMFLCNRSPLTLHYATNPLAGYHLAPAYAQLAADSPLADTAFNNPVHETSSKAMRSAITQLSEWCAAFRAVISRVTIRFVTSDALAFCHVLKYHRTHGESSSAYWYRSNWTYNPLILDAPDYSKTGSAPTIFNVIDASNLMDHLGCLNLLAATSALLKQHPTSCIRTEMLVPEEGNLAESASAMLCGDLPTVALLLGLSPIQYWTNATATWHVTEDSVQPLPGIDSGELAAAMSRPVVLWKPLNTALIQCDAGELAHLLLALYLEMFQDDKWARRKSYVGLEVVGNLTAYELYTRASFVALLRYIKEAGVTSWNEAMHLLIKQGVLDDQTLVMGPNHVQSFFVHLQTLSVLEVDLYLDSWHPRSFPQFLTGRFEGWKNIPATVCITLVVPHAAIAMFGDTNETKRTPVCQLQLHSSVSDQEFYYSDIQLGFGSIKSTGKAYSDEYALTVDEDVKGWLSNSPLIVSAMVSTCSLVADGDQACNVAFALKVTKDVVAQSLSKLVSMLHLHTSAVGMKDVFVTRYRPNMKGHIGASLATDIPKTTPPHQTPTIPTAPSAKDVVVFPVFNTATNKIASLRIRFNIVSEEGKALLQNGGTIFCEISDSSSLILKIDNKVQHALTLPFPVNAASAKTEIARKSLWIECTAPVIELTQFSLRAESLFPMLPDGANQPILENLHYIYPDVLPKLHTSGKASEVSWLAPVISPKVTMSAVEFKQYHMLRAITTLMLPGRLGVKESIQSMYSYMFGLDGDPCKQVFQFCTPTTFLGVLYVDSVRMDLSNQTTLVDAALIPYHSSPAMRPVKSFLRTRKEDGIGIAIQKDEADFWKHLLPAFVERCRQWKHKVTCEYQVSGRMPLSLDDDKPYMCTCGMGIFPTNYLSTQENSKQLLQHSVRIVIPVISASPINKDDPDAVTFPSLFKKQMKEKNAVQPPKHTSCIEDLTAKKGSCFECGAKQAKDGEALLKCAKCKVAQYCSADCQRKEWKAHKLVCQQLSED
ncbi:hypothetical protein T440DRAFT_477389 [Plenodomus tracheiphilus IPT5]|uniref:MYND-type domain-containing protein n=1 Tax=Plenodomus tracheiphilus IPT5 TaxID=1408161 RepID=A0A6A7BAL6_9PLEO|nr:hypothetical protein T440DRAFT_477389 [Plenodomus tracheiphilus IPT5]